jgi:SARP family transcriptional regulator, regulator of embCAB operon
VIVPARIDNRVQLCGELSVVLDGRECAPALRGHQARALCTYLVLERHRLVDRYDLIEALWGTEAPPAAGEALRSLLSNLRRALGAERITGRDELRLRLPADTRVDVEAAARAIHDAESAVALAQWARAWIAAHVAMNVASRPLLPRVSAAWIDERRTSLEGIRMRALEALAASGLGLGGPEIHTARRAAEALIDAEPYRESGYRLLMRALRAEGNSAQALLVFDRLRTTLRDELGVTPTESTLALHQELLAESVG